LTTITAPTEIKSPEQKTPTCDGDDGGGDLWYNGWQQCAMFCPLTNARWRRMDVRQMLN